MCLLHVPRKFKSNLLVGGIVNLTVDDNFRITDIYKCCHKIRVKINKIGNSSNYFYFIE